MELFYKEIPVKFVKNEFGEFEADEALDILRRLCGCHTINIKNTDTTKRHIIENWFMKNDIIKEKIFSDDNKFIIHWRKYKENETMDDYINRIKIIIDELELDEKIIDKLME